MIFKSLTRIGNIPISQSLCGKSVLLVQKILDANPKISSAAFFTADFNLSNCEFENFMFILLCSIIYTLILQNFYRTLQKLKKIFFCLFTN